MDGHSFFAELRASTSLESRTPKVVTFEPGIAVPEGAVVVGRPAPDGAPSSILAIDNKSLGIRTATEVVANAEAAFFRDWPLWRRRPVVPTDVLRAVTLVVEDASPDSVWAVIALLGRLADCDLRPILERWQPAIARWEAGDGVDDVETNWMSLASALGHANFGSRPSHACDGFPVAWQRLLHFAAESALLDRGPSGIEPVDDWPALREARAALAQERQTYEEWRARARVTQLSLPIVGHDDRRLLVDALIFVEETVTGSAKLFYRTDTSSPLGRGYAFAASYRPGAPPGSDVTIAVDPSVGIHLGPLWEKLEQREDAAWSRSSDPRPSWSPRASRLGPANQPWWIDESGTLIGAPRSVELREGSPRECVPGSKLRWPDVQDAIWDTFNPLRDLQFEIYPKNDRVRFEDVADRGLAADSNVKRVIVARWSRTPEIDNAFPRSLVATLVFGQFVSAILARVAGDRVTLRSLTLERERQRVDLSAGTAFVTRDGVFLLCDWREGPQFEVHRLSRICENASAFEHELRILEDDSIAPLAADVAGLIRNGRSRRESPDLVVKAAEILVDLSELRARNTSVPADGDARLLDEQLAGAWALHRRLDAMERQMNALATSLRLLGDGQIRRVTQLVALIAFPFYLASGLTKPAADAVDDVLRSAHVGGAWVPSVGGEPRSVVWWLCFACLFGSLIYVAMRVKGRLGASYPSQRRSVVMQLLRPK